MCSSFVDYFFDKYQSQDLTFIKQLITQQQECISGCFYTAHLFHSAHRQHPPRCFHRHVNRAPHRERFPAGFWGKTHPCSTCYTFQRGCPLIHQLLTQTQQCCPLCPPLERRPGIHSVKYRCRSTCLCGGTSLIPLSLGVLTLALIRG